MSTKKYLFCNKCSNFPDKIVEVYEGKLHENRKWDGDCYELEHSNIEDLPMESHCGVCSELLVEV